MAMLVLAACLGLLTVVAAIVRPAWAALSITLTAIAALASVAVLVWALITLDFSLVYVADTTTRDTPPIYRVSALWGAMDGSLLLWATMHAVVGAIAARRAPEVLRARVAATAGLIVAAELALVLFLANPFRRLAIPAVDGGGLVAVLRHPAMVIHPPTLYLGLTLLLAPFAFVVATAAAIKRGQERSDADDLGNLLRPWLLSSWLILTIGMALGARWAYVEAGWGGYWAWDAVENTSLLPWLALTAAIHALPSPTRRARIGQLAGFTSLAFASTTLGVVLTRSGVTASVHTFAEATDIGIGLLVVLVAVVVAAAVATQQHWGKGRSFALRERPRWHVDPSGANALLLTAVWIVVALGTLAPVIERLASGRRSSIGPSFYANLTGPLALLALLLIGVFFTNHHTSRAGGASTTRRQWLTVAAVPVVGAVVAVLAGRPPLALAVMVSAAFALLALGSTFSRKGDRAPFGVVLSHLGLALMIGAAAGTALGAEDVVRLSPGEQAGVDGSTVVLKAITTGRADEFTFVRAEITVDDTPAVVELRRYRDTIRPTSEAVLRPSPLRDKIIVLRDVDARTGDAQLAIFIRPLVSWMWLGVVLMIVGVAIRASSTRALPVGGDRTEVDPEAAASEQRDRSETTTRRPTRTTS